MWIEKSIGHIVSLQPKMRKCGCHIAIHKLSDSENKNVALEKSLQQTNLKPCDFWAGEALEARTRDCLNITLAQKWQSTLF